MSMMPSGHLFPSFSCRVLACKRIQAIQAYASGHSYLINLLSRVYVMRQKRLGYLYLERWSTSSQHEETNPEGILHHLFWSIHPLYSSRSSKKRRDIIIFLTNLVSMQKLDSKAWLFDSLNDCFRVRRPSLRRKDCPRKTRLEDVSFIVKNSHYPSSSCLSTFSLMNLVYYKKKSLKCPLTTLKMMMIPCLWSFVLFFLFLLQV